MNKEQMVKAYSKQFGITQKTAKICIDQMGDFIYRTLLNGDELFFKNLVRIGTRVRKAINGRNFVTNKPEYIPPTRIPCAKFAEEFRKEIAELGVEE